MSLRSRHLFAFDVVAIFTAFVLSFVMRFDTAYIWPQLSQYWPVVLPVAVVKLAAFYYFGLYRRVWRYASMPEMVAIVAAVTVGSVVMALIVLWGSSPPGPTLVQGFPRSVIAIDWLLTAALVGGSRFSLRVWEESRPAPDAAGLKGWREPEKRVLVVGAGDAGAMIVREMQSNPGLGILPVGFVDDDQRKQGMHIRGVPVLGTRESIPDLVRLHQVDEVIIAMPTAPGRVIRDLIGTCKAAGVKFKTIPGIYELIDGRVSVKQVREVRIEDLLRREPVEIPGADLKELFAGHNVLVTGAGGSIGGELCRQIALYEPVQLILFGHGENSIFQIELELRRLFPKLEAQAVIGDIRDKARVEAVMARYRPRIVFHSAAHKHVPLMEGNIVEAVTNNVFGTLLVAEAAARYGVERFVLLSTDKAVNPISVLGASKRVAELIMQSLAQENHTIFTAVRFGNVLGSRGSLIPLLQQQIAAGGPVTVTHPEATRYFMTIPEAAKLVLQAAALAQGGETFVLDMGEPVRILDLAQELIELSGLKVGHDIPIVFVGLRPGEKLHEELASPAEKLIPTGVPKVLVLRSENTNPAKLYQDMAALQALVEQEDEYRIRLTLKGMVPEFQWQPCLGPASERPRLEEGHQL